MSRVFIRGDIHGNPEMLSAANFPVGRELTKEDYVIICGDFGIVWNQVKGRGERWWLKWLDERPWTTLFVPGNHENFDRLESDEFETREWNGGKIKVISDSVYMLNYGDIFTIGGKTFLSVGKAASHDIQHGIIDPADYATREEMKAACRALERKHGGWRMTMYRIKGESWWPQEIPTAAEREYTLSNLASVGNKVDYILSHELPSSDVILLGKNWYKPDEYSIWLENEIRQKVDYKMWFGGHYHENKRITDKEMVLYNEVYEVKLDEEIQ